MTPIVKLVFGAQYDKTRLTEFAAALSWAQREGVAAGALAERIETLEGGLKAIVAAERAARRPAPKPDRWAELRAQLHAARPLARVDIEIAGDEEFVLLVARREEMASPSSPRSPTPSWSTRRSARARPRIRTPANLGRVPRSSIPGG